MTIGVRNNIVAVASAGRINETHESLRRTHNRISSGNRIARIGDDSSGAAVATNLSIRANSARQAIRNVNDALSINHTSQTALRTTINMIDRMRELAVQSASEPLEDTQRQYVSDEYDALAAEMKRLVFVTKHDGINLGAGGTITVQVGTGNDSDADEITIKKSNIKTLHVVMAAQDLSDASDAQDALSNIDNVFKKANLQMSTMGSQENRLTAAISNATSHIESLRTSSSRIKDTDFAVETATMTAQQIRLQAGTVAMLQAHNLSRGVIEMI